MSKKKYIALKPFNNPIFYKNKIFNLDLGDNIFFDFKNKLKNIDINTVDLIKGEKVDKYVYCDMPYFWNFSSWFNLIFNKTPKILFCFESPLVNPFSHMRILHRFFSKVYTWNRTIIKSSKYNIFFIPQLNKDLSITPKAFNDKKFILMVNSNKFIPLIFKILSPYKKDLYKERLKAINFFDKEAYDKFSLYGKGWNKPKKFSLFEKVFGCRKYNTYKGAIEVNKKIEVLSEYKYCLCFENAIAEGYITEKIFDCFKAGCVPVYLGDPHIERFIDRKCFIDLRKFLSYDELLNFLDRIDEEEYNGYLKNIKHFLLNKSERKRWFEEGFKDVFLKSIA